MAVNQEVHPTKETKTQKIPIQDAYRKKIPFTGLESRACIATVFSYYGYSEEVSDFMKRASHQTRAYFVNADKLRGFLMRSIITDLREAE